MARDFQQILWDSTLEEDCRQVVRLAVREDLDRWHDWTTLALVGPDARGEAAVVSRRPGVICGLRAAGLALEEMDALVDWSPAVDDGARVAAGTPVATLLGSARSLLTAERTVLNFVGHLSGIASLTAEYVAAVAVTGARIYDTRKTTPGWRRLEKYAVHCGGGHNHRTGLFDAILIKDNHLAFGAQDSGSSTFGPAEAVLKTRRFAEQATIEGVAGSLLIEVEVDTLDQLDAVLAVRPDIVLLDNMTPKELAEAVDRRNQVSRETELEASGGVTLSNVRAIAESGVERISIGALTHSAAWLDIGLDWHH